MSGYTVKQRFAALLSERDGGWYCHYCGIALDGEDPIVGEPREIYDVRAKAWNRDGILIRSAQVDHILATSKGGKSRPENLVLSCDVCNARKASKSYAEFIAQIGGAK